MSWKDEFELEGYDVSEDAWESEGVRRAAGVRRVLGGGEGAAVVRKPPRRRKTECKALSAEHEMRMAFGEVRLLEAMRYERLREGVSYHFITWGDADSLSFLKVCLNGHALEWLVLSTWCMSAEDILQIEEWWRCGRIGRVDIYVGEIFPGSYKREWEMLEKFYGENPGAGRCVSFRNHCKVFAGGNASEGFHFVVETSANVNTNPRTEQGVITVSKELSEFYRGYFDGIEKEEDECRE